MVARITRLLLLFQLLIAFAASVAAARVFDIDNTLLAALTGIGFVVLFRLLITCNNFFLAWRYRSAIPAHHRISAWQAATLFFGEFRATMTASSWTMPFRLFSRRGAARPEGLPVLLIHGYGCNSGYWHPLSKALQKANIIHHAVDLEPVIGGIDDYVPMIDAAVERLCRETGYDKIVIVAHSMGGLATRAYLRARGPARLAKAITLGTPHHGTALAHFGVGLNTHQMRWTATEQEGIASDWLRELKAGEDPALYRLFVSIYSHHDNIISPQISSHLEGARNIELNAVGHVALGFDPTVQALVIREIRAASAARMDTPTPATAGAKASLIS
ncbi:MAG TPA: alpha/beta fold hydrolase [Noviherbaspirillum sp.]|uniref:esterase/lipase family protein n=1 Tax=Noviherbaspirillum sp. TaxID=1926288 RepID=UPI002D44F393|nr:alpha/beta fold hydrolase [Noviherbaspirillum sp.]HYD96071.1 alpha/beta fold hydrolase [Noviherbaspirillum sp.]